MKKLLAILLICAMALTLAACGAKKETGNSSTNGIIKIELYEDVAPITVANFKKLVSEGFYDGIIFHRVISGFMIQGGDPTGTGGGGSDETIKGEFSSNGVENNLEHTRGVVSMARTNVPDSASSQFFICHQDSPHLNGDYAAFGKVIEGMEVVDAIAAVTTDMSDKPLTEQKIKTIRMVEGEENVVEIVMESYGE